jgi:hypothetical protein
VDNSPGLRIESQRFNFKAIIIERDYSSLLFNICASQMFIKLQMLFITPGFAIIFAFSIDRTGKSVGRIVKSGKNYGASVGRIAESVIRIVISINRCGHLLINFAILLLKPVSFLMISKN